MMSVVQGSSRFTGRRLILLRVLWASAAVVFTALFLAAIPQIPERAGQDQDFNAWLELALEAYYLALALFIFCRRSDDWMACILSLTFMMALSTDNVQSIFGSGPLFQRLDLVLAAISSTLLLCLFYIFPDGRFVPRWTRWAAVAAAGIQLWRIFFEEAYMERGFALVGLLMFTGPVALIYRYFRASDVVVRKQIKWVVFCLAVMLPPLGIALILFSFGTNPVETGTLGEQIGAFVWAAFLVIFPLSITISILRYRLWDIDVIIRKTLIYGALTALLALVYFGAIVLLQSILGTLTGERSPLILVVSTLLIAALFAPLRRRVQEVIDRRFYRRKYDAQQVLAQFAATASDEVDLDQLTAELVRVVEETMRPERVVVWLRDAKATRPGSAQATYSGD